MEIRNARGVVALHLDRFAQYVGIVAAQAGDFLLQTRERLHHQILIARAPQFVFVRQRALDLPAVSLDDVLSGRLGAPGRQMPVPEHHLASFGHDDCRSKNGATLGRWGT